MRVFLTGGTGAIGSHALPALIDAGHQVTAMVRNATKGEAVRRAGATPVELSIFDRAGLTEAFDGHAAVVNLASALPSTQRFIMKSAWAQCHRIRTEGSPGHSGSAITASGRRPTGRRAIPAFEKVIGPWPTSCPRVTYVEAMRVHHASDALSFCITT